MRRYCKQSAFGKLHLRRKIIPVDALHIPSLPVRRRVVKGKAVRVMDAPGQEIQRQILCQTVNGFGVLRRKIHFQPEANLHRKLGASHRLLQSKEGRKVFGRGFAPKPIPDAGVRIVRIPRIDRQKLAEQIGVLQKADARNSARVRLLRNGAHPFERIRTALQVDVHILAHGRSLPFPRRFTRQKPSKS